jgi:hypothetical protein
LRGQARARGLPLGADAVASIREKLARVAADVDETEAVARSIVHRD